MNDTVRSDLIKQLATSSGLVDVHDSKYSGSHYDSNTGTFYCEGMTIPRNSISNALRFFQKQMYTYKEAASRDKNMLEMYMNFAVAANAIMMLSETTDKLK